MGRPRGTKYQKSLSLRVDEDVWASLEQMAVDEERPIGMMARILLREAVEARKTPAVKGKKG